MKKSSVLIRRAALFTATVMAVTVAVSLCGYVVGTWIQLNQVARRQLKPQLEYLAGIAAEGLDAGASDDEVLETVRRNLEDEAQMLMASGEYVWLLN